MNLFITMTVLQYQLQLKRTLALFADHICCGGFDACIDDGVIGSSGVFQDGIVVRIDYIYLIFPSWSVQN